MGRDSKAPSATSVCRMASCLTDFFDLDNQSLDDLHLLTNTVPDVGPIANEAECAKFGYERTPPVLLVCTSGPAEGTSVSVGSGWTPQQWHFTERLRTLSRAEAEKRPSFSLARIGATYHLTPLCRAEMWLAVDSASNGAGSSPISSGDVFQIGRTRLRVEATTVSKAGLSADGGWRPSSHGDTDAAEPTRPVRNVRFRSMVVEHAAAGAVAKAVLGVGSGAEAPLKGERIAFHEIFDVQTPMLSASKDTPSAEHQPELRITILPTRPTRRHSRVSRASRPPPMSTLVSSPLAASTTTQEEISPQISPQMAAMIAPRPARRRCRTELPQTYATCASSSTVTPAAAAACGDGLRGRSVTIDSPTSPSSPAFGSRCAEGMGARMSMRRRRSTIGGVEVDLDEAAAMRLMTFCHPRDSAYASRVAEALSVAPSLDEMMADEDDKSITLRDGDRLGLDELGGLVAMPPATTGAAATGAVAEEDDDDDAVAIAVVRFHGRRFWLHELPLARAAERLPEGTRPMMARRVPPAVSGLRTPVEMGTTFTLGASHFRLTRPLPESRSGEQWRGLAASTGLGLMGGRGAGAAECDYVALPAWPWLNHGAIGRANYKKATLGLKDVKARRRHAHFITECAPSASASGSKLLPAHALWIQPHKGKPVQILLGRATHRLHAPWLLQPGDRFCIGRTHLRVLSATRRRGAPSASPRRNSKGGASAAREVGGVSERDESRDEYFVFEDRGLRFRRAESKQKRRRKKLNGGESSSDSSDEDGKRIKSSSDEERMARSSPTPQLRIQLVAGPWRGREVECGEGGCTIGSSEACTVSLPTDLSVEDVHATVTHVDGQWYLACPPYRPWCHVACPPYRPWCHVAGTWQTRARSAARSC